MGSNSNNDFLAIIIFVSLLFCGLVWKFSSFLGADFQTTLIAVILSAVVLGITIFLIWVGNLNTLPSLTAATAMLWPSWWGVIHSIATGGKDQNMDFMFDQPWWDTRWTKWGIEVFLIALAVWLFMRTRDRY